MAFNDAPEVDENSKASEESVNVVRTLFTKKNGPFLFSDNFRINRMLASPASGTSYRVTNWNISYIWAIPDLIVMNITEQAITLFFKAAYEKSNSAWITKRHWLSEQ